jgi:glycosyltransferase involved in cell wall biosynthesis
VSIAAAQTVDAGSTGGVRSIVGRGVRRVGGAVGRLLTDHWPPYTRLFLLADSPRWVLSEEMRELGDLARAHGIVIADPRWAAYSRRQAVFYASHFQLLSARWEPRPHRIGVSYYHGRPGTGVAAFDLVYQRLCAVHPDIARVQVSHSEMRDLVLESGIAPEKVFLIPIAVNLDYFSGQTPDSRREARTRLGIPQSAVVIGSFQKDGVGWNDGLQPKLEKGPDILIETVRALAPRIPELFVLLTGPARGYVRQGLETFGVPHLHMFPPDYRDLCRVYQAVDLTLVTSRQEGGPKAVLESMAAGVPLVTTRVGQAMDLVRHGENAWMADVEDVDALAHWAAHVLLHRDSLGSVLARARETAERHSYTAQTPQWRALLDGFVTPSGSAS